MQRGGHGAVIGHLARISESVCCGRRLHLDQRIARIGPGMADRDPFDPKRSSACRDAIENLRQNQAVDNMAADFDLFDVPIGGGGCLVRRHDPILRF